MSDKQNPFIEITDLVKKFGTFTALNGVSLDVMPGEVHALLGDNGAGKSTTINILLGFLQPDSGFASIDGMDTSKQFEETRKITGYISENVSLYPYLSALENLDYFCKINGNELSLEKLNFILNKCGLDKSVQNQKIEN